MIKFTLSVAVHNCLHLTKQFFESLQSTIGAWNDWELIITDNASDQPTKDYLIQLCQEFSHVSVITHDVNIGFGDAHNNALFYAKGDYFIVLNNDIIFKQLNWHYKMYEKFKSSWDIQIVGVEGMCGKLNKQGYGETCNKDNIEYIEGSCMMIRTTFARKVTLFDTLEFPFGYCEDSDLSLRVRKLGFSIATVNINLAHVRYSTGKEVEKKLDLVGINKMNHLRFQRRWRNYLDTKSFVRHILLIRKGGKGDVLLMSPIIAALKAENAYTHITVATLCPDVLKYNPNIDSIIDLTNSSENVIDGYYDCVYNLDNAYENFPEMHIVHAYEKAVGLTRSLATITPSVYSKPSEKALAYYQLAVDSRKSSKKLCCVHFEVHPSWVGRAPSPSFQEEIKLHLYSKGYAVLDLTKDVKNLKENDLYELMKYADLFVGIDSFPFHVAQAFHIPSVVMFGLINPKYRVCEPAYVECLQHKHLKCLGCHHLLPLRTVTTDCPRDFSKGFNSLCMRPFNLTQLDEAVKEVLKRKMYTSETQKIRQRVRDYIEINETNVEDPNNNLKILDIGCGTDKIFKGAYGIDKRHLPGVDEVIDISKGLPFENESYDYVYSSHCLEDLVDPKETLAEWLRVLKPQGSIILYLPHKDYYKGFNADHLHGQGFTNTYITDILEQLNVKVVISDLDVGEDRYSLYVVGVKK